MRFQIHTVATFSSFQHGCYKHSDINEEISDSQLIETQELPAGSTLTASFIEMQKAINLTKKRYEILCACGIPVTSATKIGI